MKVIFLDIDGVLNSTNTKHYTSYTHSTFVDNKMLSRLKRIIKDTGAEVVLSSDWRYDKEDERYNQDFIELRDLLSDHGIEFYGFTPEIHNAPRSEEIYEFLKSHTEITNYVVLDDRIDACTQLEYFVRTLMSVGLTDENVDQAIEILNKNN